MMNRFFSEGQTVLFQGDSVTDCSRSRTDLSDLSAGYPGKIATSYNTLFAENNIKFINRGVSGNRTIDLLTRYEEDFKAIRPDFVSILIGINDTWRRYDSNDETTAEQYEKNYEELLLRLKKDLPHTKIMMIEPFVMQVQPGQRAWREDLDPKIHAGRRLANRFADYYLPMDGIFAGLQTKGFAPNLLAADGVHPTSMGHAVIANAYLKELGIL
ncbi:MAG: SGNH/GDSL hydrolase family protein [Angelakisella sp.]